MQDCPSRFPNNVLVMLAVEIQARESHSDDSVLELGPMRNGCWWGMLILRKVPMRCWWGMLKLVVPMRNGCWLGMLIHEVPMLEVGCRKSFFGSCWRAVWSGSCSNLVLQMCCTS